MPPTALDLWAMLAGPSGFLAVWCREPGERCPLHTGQWVPVHEARRFERLVRAYSYNMELLVSACVFQPNPAWRDDPQVRRVRRRYLPAEANVLWARVETPTAREAVEHFAPSPTLVLGEGAAQTALWALQQPLSKGWTELLNRRLAHKLGGKKAQADVGFAFAPAGAILREGRGRPVVVEAVSWTGELHSARAVAGNLEDPPDPQAAWRARQEAA